MKLCARAAHPSLFVVLLAPPLRKPFYALGFYLFVQHLLCGREEKGLTGVSKRGSDLDGCEVLQERLELQGGELRPPLAAGPLVQPVQKKTEEVRTMFHEDDVFSLCCPSSSNLRETSEKTGITLMNRFCVSSYCFANIWTASGFMTKSIQMCNQMCKQECFKYGITTTLNFIKCINQSRSQSKKFRSESPS